VIVTAAIVAQDTGYAQRAAFYDAVRAHDDKKAVEIGKAYLLAHPADDAFALDLAYAELRAGDNADALALFHRLAGSTDAKVGDAARAQLAVMSGSAAARGYTYSAAQYESRFNDFIVDGFSYYDLETPRALTPYVALRYTYDTRSSVGLGQIYFENYVSGAVGLRQKIGAYIYAYADAAYSIGLGGQRSFPETRYGVAGSRDYGLLDSAKPHMLVDGSIAVYSRYAGNTIGYLQMHYDVKVAGHLRAVVGDRVYADTQRLEYNNFLEVHEGALYWFTPGLYLEGLGVQGTYDGRGTPRASPAGYTTWRVLLIYGAGIH